MLADNFANIALGFSQMSGSPFIDALAIYDADAVYDDGGSITFQGAETGLPCKAQFDAATQEMRAAEGFLETDVRILVLTASLEGNLDTSAKIEVAAGRYAGRWSLLSCTQDPASVGYECRARKVN